MGHFLKIPAFIALSFPFENYAWFIFFMTLFTILGTKWGIKILFKVNDKIITSLDVLEEAKYLVALNSELEKFKQIFIKKYE